MAPPSAPSPQALGPSGGSPSCFSRACASHSPPWTPAGPQMLKDFAPCSQLPVLLYDGDTKTDTLPSEEFLEETLGPPEFPSLEPRYRESTAAGNDVFHKFSAFIKNPVPALDDGEEGLETRRGWGEWSPTGSSPRSPPPALYQHPLRALAKVDSYLRAPLEHELAREPQLRESRHRFADGEQRGLLPKLHIVNVSAGPGGADPRGDPDRPPRPQTVCAHFRQAPIPAELRGVHRYLDDALQEEFNYTCPYSAKILAAYWPAVRPR
nr:LOW QUALITY PROTEIN: chloride intracellular channel protein 3 [Kogia breviceps]